MEFIGGLILGALAYFVLSNPARRSHLFNAFKFNKDGNTRNQG